MNNINAQIKFTQYLNGLEADVSKQERVLAAAVGFYMGQTLPVVSQVFKHEEGGVEAFYVENCLPLVKRYVSKINEYRPFNTDLALSICRAYWMIRYRAVNVGDLLETIHSEQSSTGNFILDSFGTGRFFNEMDLAFLNEYRFKISKLTTFLSVNYSNV